MTPKQPSPEPHTDDDRDDRGERIEIEVNGRTTHLRANAVIDDLLDTLGLTGKKLAVARNRSVIPRSAYGTERLAASDRIEILEAVGGG